VRDEVLAYIALGANLGDAIGTVRAAIEQVTDLPLTRHMGTSSLYRSAPVDANGPDFINAVLAIKTGLNAYDLLAHLQRIELACGRERPYRNAPRTLDLDLLLFGTA
jgi:2-amino-4-hydroxy-6-hydroxymethyldihydropteridine diphosphokinase